MHRLFIAIALPDAIKAKIEETLSRAEPIFHAAPVRFQPSPQWHFTLLFLGNEPKESLTPIKDALHKTALNTAPPRIECEALCFGPPAPNRA